MNHRSRIILTIGFYLLLMNISFLNSNYLFSIKNIKRIENSDEFEFPSVIDMPIKSQMELNFININWEQDGNEHFVDVAHDNEGNIYITGYTNVSGDDDVIILKYNSSYELVWNETWGRNMSDQPRAMVLDNESNIYITGYSQENSSSPYEKEMLILKYNKSGHLQWENITELQGDEILSDGNHHDSVGNGIKLDSNNDIIICGYQWEKEKIASPYYYFPEVVLLKCDPSGNQEWLKTGGTRLLRGPGDLNFGRGYDLVLDDMDNIYVVGSSPETYPDSGGARYPLGSHFLLLKFDSSGNQVWTNTTQTFTDSSTDEYGLSIAIDNDLEHLYCAGIKEDQPFLTKFNMTGINITTSFDIPGSSFNNISLDIDDSNNVYLPTFLDDNLVLSIFNCNLTKFWSMNCSENILGNECSISINSSTGMTYIVSSVNDTTNGDDEGLFLINQTNIPMILLSDSILNKEFGQNAPTITSDELIIFGFHLNTTWYMIFNDSVSSNNITFSYPFSILQIKQSEWDKFYDGSISIRFYANDTAGNIGTCNISIIKDTIDLIISIITPKINQVFSLPPDFIVTINGTNLDDIWYTIDGGMTNFTINDNGTIDSDAWGDLSDGPVTLTFYSNDTLGHIGTDSVSIIKDTIDPIITIDSPSDDDVFETTPAFTVTYTESNQDTIWYTMDNGANNFTITGNGTINSDAWNALLDGSITLTFYINDSAGNVGTDSVSVIKNSTFLLIKINSPVPNDVINATVPDYIITVRGANQDKIWYTIDNGLNNYTTTDNSSIEPGAWSAASDGPITLIFYLNNTNGNITSDSVMIIKDTTDPIVSITTPGIDDVFHDPPDFTLSITESNIDEIWYIIDGGVNNYSCGASGTINSTAWSEFSEGPVTLVFYVKDKVNKISSDNVSIAKDTTNPSIIITTPIMDQKCEKNTLKYIIEVQDQNPHLIWYTLNNGDKIYLSKSVGIIIDEIDEKNWLSIPNGNVSLKFFALDLAGNEYEVEVIVNKNTSPTPIPEIPTEIVILSLALLGILGFGTFIIAKKIREGNRLNQEFESRMREKTYGVGIKNGVAYKMELPRKDDHIWDVQTYEPHEFQQYPPVQQLSSREGPSMPSPPTSSQSDAQIYESQQDPSIQQLPSRGVPSIPSPLPTFQSDSKTYKSQEIPSVKQLPSRGVPSIPSPLPTFQSDAQTHEFQKYPPVQQMPDLEAQFMTSPLVDSKVEPNMFSIEISNDLQAIEKQIDSFTVLIKEIDANFKAKKISSEEYYSQKIQLFDILNKLKEQQSKLKI